MAACHSFLLFNLLHILMVNSLTKCKLPKTRSSCSYTTINDNAILCNGVQSCIESYLTATKKIVCNGERSCTRAAGLTAGDSIYCNGVESCRNAKGNIKTRRGSIYCAEEDSCQLAQRDINAAQSVYCKGAHSCYFVKGRITADEDIWCDELYSCFNNRANGAGLTAGRNIVIDGESGAQFTDLQAGDSIYCKGYNSCAYNPYSNDYEIIATNDIYCDGEKSCRYSRITAGDTIYFNSLHSGQKANVVDAAQVECNAQHSCNNATINADNIIVGYEGAQYAILNAKYSVIGNGMRALELTEIYATTGNKLVVNLNGEDAGYDANIYCHSSSECSIGCQSDTACNGLTVYTPSLSNVVLNPSNCPVDGSSNVDGISCPQIIVTAAVKSQPKVNEISETDPMMLRQERKAKGIELQLLPKMSDEEIEEMFSISDDFMTSPKQSGLNMNVHVAVLLFGVILSITACYCYVHPKHQKTEYQLLV